MYEIDWAFLDGPKTFAPNLYNYFTGLFKYKDDIIENYYDKIVNQNSKLHSWVWHDYERILSQINPEKYFFDNEKDLLQREGLPNSPFMELHYIKNKFFMEDDEILKKAKSIDAYNLSKNLKSSELVFVNTAGHSSSDEGIISNMLKGLNKLVNHI